MMKIKVIERRLPHGWETLLEVNGVIGRAEEMLCLEERQVPEAPLARVVPWVWHRPEKFIPATAPPVEFVSSVET